MNISSFLFHAIMNGMDKNSLVAQAEALAKKHLREAQDPAKPWWKRFLFWLGAVIIAGLTVLYGTSCTIDRLVIEGDQGSLSYYKDPSSGKNTLYLFPAKVRINKK